MCGIVGFIGQEQAAPILLDGLAHLEYRGYDSAGVAVISAQGKLQVEKAVGRLKVLSEQIHGGADLEGCIGLGHTRWATHGAPNIINSHPHVSENGKFAVIHNGIIENYVEIKEFLIGQGIRFKSETDTEVVAQLLEFYYNECHDFLEAVGRVLRRIEGAYALGMLCADCPDRIIAARKDAPLLLGYGKGCNFLASDVTAIIKHTRDVAYMEDGEVAVLTREGIEVYDALEQKVEKKHFTIDWEVSAAEKGGYEHFMLKEIMEQPEALRRAISPRVKDGRIVFDDLKLPVEKMREFTRIFIVACGSSYHVGMIGKFPYCLILLGASALLFYYIYNKTCIACHIRAVGNEELLANALGVNAMNTKYMTFVLAGIFIGITAILQISYANSITTVSSLRSISMIFQPLMGVLIAFAIQEWCNLTLGVFISQFTLSMMFNALIALGVPSKMQDVVLGVMLIIVMGIALNNKRISGFFERKARRKELMKRA